MKYLNGIDIHKTLTRTLNKLNSDLYNYWQFISSAVDFLVNPNAPRDPYATEQMNNRLGEIDATTQKILSAIDGLKYVQLLSDTKKTYSLWDQMVLEKQALQAFCTTLM